MAAGKKQFVIGIDVGTGSARAGVFDLRGRGHGMGVEPIRLWRPAADFVEQSSKDIWRAAGVAVRRAMKQAGARPASVIGLSFDATCSLVCLGEGEAPLTVSPTGRDEQNIIVWMDHRAIDAVRRINKTRHRVLRYVGGVMSPEMEPPKLLWLKENLPGTWRRARRFLDLADFLTWRATDCDVRSLCTAVCKWTYQGHLPSPAGAKGAMGRWDESFWQKIGLGELVSPGDERIGRVFRPMGEAIGDGLTARAAKDLGLRPGTAVGVGIIDAHAGGLGMIAAPLGGRRPSPAAMNGRLALIGGTSSCHMAVSAAPRFIHGVWGPYYSAMLPGWWLNEGGQSATGALIDHCIDASVHAPALRRQARREGRTVYELLNERLAALAGGRDVTMLTSRLHVLGDHHGNRSPRANPDARGMVSGLTLNHSLDDLALAYLATVQAVAYGTRHIMDTLNRGGYAIRAVFACGGGTKNPLFLQQHADATGCALHMPAEPEAVLLGAAMLGAVAAGVYSDAFVAASAMCRAGRSVAPAGGAAGRYHDRKYQVYLEMYDHQLTYDRLMKPRP